MFTLVVMKMEIGDNGSSICLKTFDLHQRNSPKGTVQRPSVTAIYHLLLTLRHYNVIFGFIVSNGVTYELLFLLQRRGPNSSNGPSSNKCGGGTSE